MEEQNPNNQTPAPQSAQAQTQPAPQNQAPTQLVVHKSSGFKSKLPWIIIIILLVLVGIFGGYVLMNQSKNVSPEPTPTPGQTACTQEAKLCPDGSSVGRTGPNCEFEQC